MVSKFDVNKNETEYAAYINLKLATFFRSISPEIFTRLVKSQGESELSLYKSESLQWQIWIISRGTVAYKMAAQRFREKPNTKWLRKNQEDMFWETLDTLV